MEKRSQLLIRNKTTPKLSDSNEKAKMKRESQCCQCEEGRKKRKIDLPLSAGERGEKEKNMVPIDPRLPGIKKQFCLQF